MKLRIAQFTDGSFNEDYPYIIQRRVWLFWWRMATEITDGGFDTVEEAKKVAAQYLDGLRNKKHVHAYWKVN